MHYDVIIIGAGLSGLAAGIRIAHFGRRVLILERHTVWGGLNSFYKRGGHHFDVGLHAVTNWVPPGYRGPRLPLQRIARQLRIRIDELELDPQVRSSVRFDDAQLVFDNSLERLTDQIRSAFPDQVDGFVRLCALCAEYPDHMADHPFVSGRAVVSEHVTDPLLAEMLLCPLMFYGSAHEDDLDFEQFVILFNSIYAEGLCRPRRGIRQILDVLMKRYADLGGQMQRGAGVAQLVVEQGRVTRVELDGGDVLTADSVISSAGGPETAALRSDAASTARPRPGQLGFLETMWILDGDPKSQGFEDAVCFFNQGPNFAWRRPDVPVDLRSGVICCPGNYAHQPPLDHHVLRATHLADPGVWMSLPEDEYRAEKSAWVERSKDVVARYAGAFASNIRYTDAFTPRTVKHYTGHLNGAVYGSPDKQKDGRTDLQNLFLCGTDQGLVGVVGAMLSGIAMANAHVLAGAAG